MKNLIRSVAIASAMVVSMATMAQSEPAAPATLSKENATGPATPRKRIEDGWRHMALGMMIKQLALTPDQVTKGKEINGRYLKMHADLSEDMPLEERKAKVKQMLTERETEFKALLTPEQVKAYGEMRTPSGAVNERATMKSQEASGPAKVVVPVQAPAKEK